MIQASFAYESLSYSFRFLRFFRSGRQVSFFALSSQLFFQLISPIRYSSTFSSGLLFPPKYKYFFSERTSLLRFTFLLFFPQVPP